jgi:hypothetical protein
MVVGRDQACGALGLHHDDVFADLQLAVGGSVPARRGVV